MFLIKFPQLFCFQKRRVTAQDHDRAGIIMQDISSLQHCMAGSQLFRLEGGPCPVPDQGLHHLSPVTHDHHIIPAARGFRRVHYMLQHGASPHFMQHFR